MMNKENATNKKEHILYIDRDYSASTTGYKSSIYISGVLKKKYGLVKYKDLDGGVIDLVRKGLPAKKFAALITHVPYGSSFRSSDKHSLGRITETIELSSAYSKSTAILKEIKKTTDIPIIAYTGAGDSSAIYAVFMEEGGVDCIVHKTLDSKDDLRNILSALEKLLLKYRQMPLNIPKPVLRIENGYTVTEVRVNLNDGMGLSSVTAIYKECNSYPGNIFLRKSEEAERKERCDGKKIFDLMIMAPQEGTKITILVEGEDDNAKRQALRLYSAFSSRYSFTMDFEKFIE